MPENPSYILACDIGGTHITSVIVNTTNWEILMDTYTRSHVNSAANAKSIFQEWTDNIKLCLSKVNVPINFIGIAMPGPFDYEKGISLMRNQDKYDAIYELDVTTGIKDELQIPSIEIRYINDAAAFLQGEIYAQELDGENRVLGITLGTGLGSAVWVKGDKAFDAGLWQQKYGDSIFEEYLVTRWFTHRFEELTGIKENGFKEIIQNHQNTDAFQTLMQEYRVYLHDFISFFSELHQCKNFVIGGNIAKAWDLISVDNSFNEFRITQAQYAEKAALIGAASIF